MSTSEPYTSLFYSYVSRWLSSFCLRWCQHARLVQQLDEITETAAEWNSASLSRASAKAIQDRPECKKFVEQPFHLEVRGQEVAVKFTGENWSFGGVPETQKVLFREEFSPSLFGQPVNTESPLTISAFRQLWDSAPFVFCPTVLSDEYAEGIDRVLRIERLPGSDASESVELSLKYAKPGIFNKKREQVDFGDFAYSGYLHTHKFVVEIKIPIAYGEYIRLNWRAELTGAHNWRHLEFAQAFYELDQATTGFQDLDYPHVRDVLKLQEQNSKELFEAFGIKFPVEKTMRWGVLLILGIQLYLWMHMAEYRRRRFPDTNVAWIGSYPNVIPRVVFTVSGLLVPAGVIVFVLFFQREFALPGRILSDVALAVTATLAGLTWREYSKQGEAKAPAAKD